MSKLQQDADLRNDAGRLRALLATCETALASLRRCDGAALLTAANEAGEVVLALNAKGVDVRAERERLATIEARLTREAAAVLTASGGVTAYRALRARLGGDATNDPIWRLDAVVDANRRRLLTRILASVTAIAALVFAGYIFRGALFPPDPVGDATLAAQRSVSAGDLHAALRAVEVGLTEVPDSGTLLVWRSVLLNKRGAAQDADAAFAKAGVVLSADDALIERALVYVTLAEGDAVISDASTLIARQPQSAEAHVLLASGYEYKNDLAGAMRALNRASELAEAQDKAALVATIRVRIAELAQRGAPLQP